MKIGTIVTYATLNPSSKTSRIGVIVPGDSDFGKEYVLIAEGVFSVDEAENGNYNIISRRIDELTELAPSIAKVLLR